MKKEDIGKIVVEGLVSIALSVIVEGVVSSISAKMKPKGEEHTMVSDLTVAELKQILNEMEHEVVIREA